MNSEFYVADFETTVDDDTTQQTNTEVWSCAICRVGNLDPEEVEVYGSIDDFITWCLNRTYKTVVWFHNLKFDGSFILNAIMRDDRWKENSYLNEEGNKCFFKSVKDMIPMSYKYVISSMGQWYTITLKNKRNVIIEIRDSLKLLPFSVKAIGKGFKTKYQKLEMEYKGTHYAGCEIDPVKELPYIKNDVLVMSEAMKMALDMGMKKLTIGACCMSEYKRMFKDGKVAVFDMYRYDEIYPNLREIKLEDTYGADNADAYIRKSYFGGWCYLVPEKANKVFEHGETYDVNSLYPSMMDSESGNIYPWGKPYFWKGEIPEKATRDDTYYFVRFRCDFFLKKDMLPFIQIKYSWLYKSNEMLVTNMIYSEDDGKYHNRYMLGDEEYDTRVELTMTQTDFERFKDHYWIYKLEILDGCYFAARPGMYDEYIRKYREQKINAEGAKRNEAKLYMNNLYGKLATSDNSSYKIAKLVDGILRFDTVEEHERKVEYIAAGSAVTSYSRDFTIRHAQKNYHGAYKHGFIYADTDSIHMDCKAEGLRIHPKDFNAWKNESSWDKAIFVRQKTYIEHVTHEDGKGVEDPYYNIKCAGMSSGAKDTLNKALEAGSIKMTDFKVGIHVKGDLKPKQVEGGVVLVEKEYVMR
ncbi:MAG: hypothetical protein NC311_10775 [Muribaculaceae bacterium]|nr:hypothetical protein [Muribaculaceae bacterium]